MNKINTLRSVRFRKPAGSCYPLSTVLKQTLPMVIPTSKGINVISKSLHTDIPPPDFSAVRRKAVQSPTAKSGSSSDDRKLMNSSLVFLATATGLYAAKSVMLHYITFMAASKEVLALSKIEVKLNEIPEGKNATFKWRGKPLFVRHRSEEEVSIVRAVDIMTLRDPQRDQDRVKKDSWLVIIGVCTHLGCVPIAHLGDFGGYYCPCHGSHFDASGRARKGPAPSNMVVPEHTFVDDNTLIVG